MTSAIPFAYREPTVIDRVKVLVRLADTDILHSQVQVVREGGENNLHSHRRQDGFWFVLSGSCRFYGEGDEVIAELDRNDGIVVPRGVSYWFRSTGSAPLEILHVAALDAPDLDVRADRVDHAPRTKAVETAAEGSIGSDG